MVTISHELPSDVAARETLLDQAFGPKRRRKTAERLREGRLPAEGLAFVARNGDAHLLGTVRLWNVEAGSGGPALLLGPIAVE
jgi:predicted N-acetyltransferase YhbS